MALNSTLLGEITPEFSKSLIDLIFWVKAVGILFIIYLVAWVINWIMNFLRNIRIKKMYRKIEEIEEKLDRLLKEKENKKK